MKNFSASLLSVFVMLNFFFLYSENSQAVTITNLKAVYKNGQVFLTWTNVSDTNTTYKIYRSPAKIKKGGKLPFIEFLGMERYNSANNNNLSAHYLRPIHYSLDSGATTLSSTTGLCVLTSIQKKSNYYCVTTVSNGVEDTTIKIGMNSLSTPVAESIATPVPLYQGTDDSSFNKPVMIYADFVSSRGINGAPLRFNAAFFGSDFSVYVPTLTAPASLTVKFHGGGADLFHGITQTTGPNQVLMGVEDEFPNGYNSVWIGTNKNVDILNYNTNTIPPTTDTDYTYTLDRLNAEITWVSKHFGIDTNQIHTFGDSFGCIGAYFVGLLKPTHIATVQITSGNFNLAFDSDWEADCTMNEGEKNRVDGDNRFGTIATNLPSNLKIPFYNIVNGGYDLHHFITRDIPLVFAVNGKYDELLGWTECVSYYDSVNHNLAGGFYLWDLRDHSGDNKTWNSTNFNFIRYYKNQSYPALSNCSANGNPGNGTGTSGDTAGTINGFVDWDNNNTIDNNGSWSINLLLRSLLTWDNKTVPPPDSCTTNITPRRLQHFKVPMNATVKYRVKHKGKTIQQGTFVYKGGLMTVPGVKIYTDTVNVQLTYSGSQPNDRASEGNANVLIYPNPDHGQFSVSFNNPDLPANIEVRNLIGDLITTQAVSAGANEASIQLPEHIPSGMYLVRILIGNNSTVQKIMVQ